MLKLMRRLQTVLALSVFVSGSPSSAEPQCRNGAQNVSLTLLLSSGDSLALHVASDYFDQQFIPTDGSRRDGLLLRMQATDFSPWPREIRPHTSEGPLMRYLLAEFLPLDIVADGSERIESG